MGEIRSKEKVLEESGSPGRGGGAPSSPARAHGRPPAGASQAQPLSVVSRLSTAQTLSAEALAN